MVVVIEVHCFSVCFPWNTRRDKAAKEHFIFLLFFVWREKEKNTVCAPSIFEWPTTATAQGHAHKPKQIHAKHPQCKMHAQTHMHCIFRHLLSLSLMKSPPPSLPSSISLSPRTRIIFFSRFGSFFPSKNNNADTSTIVYFIGIKYSAVFTYNECGIFFVALCPVVSHLVCVCGGPK